MTGPSGTGSEWDTHVWVESRQWNVVPTEAWGIRTSGSF